MNFWPKDTGEGEKAMLRIIEEMSRSETNYVSQMLMREVTPLAKYNPRRDKLTYNTQVAATVRASKTKGAYQAVMEGKGWILASVVEQALGCKPRTAIKWLHTAVTLGYVEKRKSEVKGVLWEWRWVK